jgi:hypothetical protein
MIVRQYYVNAWLGLAQARLWRVLRSMTDSYPAQREKFGDYWEWKIKEAGEGFTFRFGMHGDGIMVEVACPDESHTVLDEFESKACLTERFERLETHAELRPISLAQPKAPYVPTPALLPVELIAARWSGMHPQEQAYATCLFDCVRLEHMMRKYMPDMAKMVPAPDGMVEVAVAASDPEEGILPSEESEKNAVPATSPKLAMGMVAWAFVHHPQHADLLVGMGINYNFTKLVAFRNYLIHGVNAKSYTSGKLKKNYEMLQYMLYYLKRWPSAVSIHQAMASLIEVWFSQSGLHGPPAPPSFLLTAHRRGRSAEINLGLDVTSLATLNQALSMLVLSDPPYAANEMTIVSEKLRIIEPKYSNDHLPSA